MSVLKTYIFCQIQAPRHCSYVQQVLYNYSFYDNNHPYDVKMYGPKADPGLHSDGFFEKGGSYRLELTYWEEGLPLNLFIVTKYFCK